MASPARSVAAPTAPSVSEWPWHVPVVGSVKASLLASSQRRLEAETYLRDGYGIRLAIEAKRTGWVRFGEVAHAASPPRIKQVLVAPGHGVPYLNTSQVFEPRPMPRKWLAMEKTNKGSDRLVKAGTILVMASATVGRAIVATKAHEGAIVSHHFMRVTPVRNELAGWVYAFLRSSQARAMIGATQYASVIRHIEPHHLAELPMPQVPAHVAEGFRAKVDAIVACREKAADLRRRAEAEFERAVGPIETRLPEVAFSASISALRTGRRRMEAAYHLPQVQEIIRAFGRWDRLGDITKRIWWGKRFKRHYGDGGIPYMSADDVFTTNPYATRRILVSAGDGHEDFFVERGWLIMACSGQTYGLNGSATIATEWHENTFFSHDLIRIMPKEGARPGYLLTALTHPSLGRPLLIREAYGMSIPHLDPDDVALFPVVRLGEATEEGIADLAEQAVSEQARAEVLERQLAEEASAIMSRFLVQSPAAGGDEDATDLDIARKRLEEIERHPELVLRGESLAERMARWES